jgi:chaperonin GroEL
LGLKLENVTVKDLGRAKTVPIEARTKQIRAQIEDTESAYDREKPQERPAKLVGAAVEEGTVPGGGVAPIRALSAIEKLTGISDDQVVGVSIIRRAREEPRRQISTNAGKEGSIIVQGVRQG